MTSAGNRARQARRRELASFLRARRERLRPADLDLPAAGHRRTPGLRREEVAQLAGVSVTWYTWLEQGRDISASPQVIDAIARALLLDRDDHRHLRDLADHPAVEVQSLADDVRPRLQSLVDALTPNVASIYDAHFDYLVWNTPYARVRNDPDELPADRRNLLWMMFTHTENRARMVAWEPAARSVLSQFRASAGRRPDDSRFKQIVSEVSAASPEFRSWWNEYPIRQFRPAMIEIDHPDVGRLGLELFQFRPIESPDLVLVLQRPATDDDRRRITSLIERDQRALDPMDRR